MMKLNANDVRAEFDLEAGGRLASLVVRGSELLVDREDNPMGWGAYPMVPWAGRVNHGTFNFQGANYALPITLAPHAIHGTAYTSMWTAGPVSSSNSTGVASAQGSMRLDLVDPWPFGGVVEQRAQLTESSLRLELEVTASSRAMPAMAGWHPWFRREIEGATEPVSLSFGPARMWELDDQAIPTGNLVESPDGPWDNCFRELESDPVLRWGDHLTVRLTSNCDDWVIYTEPDHAVCVEPQTSAPDSFNRSPDVVQPGESLLATFDLSW